MNLNTETRDDLIAIGVVFLVFVFVLAIMGVIVWLLPA